MRIPILSELELIFLVQESRLIYEILCFYWWGNMASCIVSGLSNTNTDKYRITVCDPNQAKLDLLKEKYKVEIVFRIRKL